MQVDPLHVFPDQEMRLARVLGVGGGDHVRMGQVGGGATLAANLGLACFLPPVRQ